MIEYLLYGLEPDIKPYSNVYLTDECTEYASTQKGWTHVLNLNLLFSYKKKELMFEFFN